MPKLRQKQTKWTRRSLMTIAMVVIAIIAVGGYTIYTLHTQQAEAAAKTATSKSVSSSKKAASVSSSKVKAKKAAAAKAINWRKSSEKKAYPDVDKYPNLWIHVSTEKQRVYLMNGNKVLYTMYCSTGVKSNPTPHGTYHIQAERGSTFYNAKEKEGANYWVSWSGHGSLLFHTVPIDANGNYIKSEAKKLGKPAGGSHGCVRLSVPDAKWMYENIKYGTKVVIN